MNRLSLTFTPPCPSRAQTSTCLRIAGWSTLHLLQANAHQHHAGEHEAETGHLEDGAQPQTTHDARAQAISLPDRANDSIMPTSSPDEEDD
jgi:hypothetical protein